MGAENPLASPSRSCCPPPALRHGATPRRGFRALRGGGRRVAPSGAVLGQWRQASPPHPPRSVASGRVATADVRRPGLERECAAWRAPLRGAGARCRLGSCPVPFPPPVRHPSCSAAHAIVRRRMDPPWSRAAAARTGASRRDTQFLSCSRMMELRLPRTAQCVQRVQRSPRKGPRGRLSRTTPSAPCPLRARGGAWRVDSGTFHVHSTLCVEFTRAAICPSHANGIAPEEARAVRQRQPTSHREHRRPGAFSCCQLDAAYSRPSSANKVAASPAASAAGLFCPCRSCHTCTRVNFVAVRCWKKWYLAEHPAQQRSRRHSDTCENARQLQDTAVSKFWGRLSPGPHLAGPLFFCRASGGRLAVASDVPPSRGRRGADRAPSPLHDLNVARMRAGRIAERLSARLSRCPLSAGHCPPTPRVPRQRRRAHTGGLGGDGP